MPCYTEWDAYLEKGSKEYETKKAELEAKLKAVRHIVDYYYGSAGLSVPPARWSGKDRQLPRGPGTTPSMDAQSSV